MVITIAALDKIVCSLYMVSLTYLLNLLLNSSPLDIMAAILQMIFSDEFCMHEKICILIKISLKFVPKGSTDNTPALL